MTSNKPTWRVAFQSRHEAERELSSDEVLQFLSDLEKSGKVPVQQCLELVMHTDAATCSVTKDNPFMYFYVRRLKNELSIRFRTKSGEVSLTLPKKKWLNRI